jgi:hypothetical protein
MDGECIVSAYGGFVWTVRPYIYREAYIDIPLYGRCSHDAMLNCPEPSAQPMVQ